MIVSQTTKTESQLNEEKCCKRCPNSFYSWENYTAKS